MINFLRRRTVAGITSSLTSMVKELQAHAKSKAAERAQHQTEAAKAMAQANEAGAEIDKAKLAAEKIGSLFS